MQHRQFWTRFFLAAALLTAVMIFCFSAQKGEDSSELSRGVTVQVAQIVRPDYVNLPVPAQRSYLDWLGHIVRKNAHFLEYALLGFNLMGFFSLRGPARPRLRAWGVATLYAATDELHQMFVDSRGPAALDVVIDSSGALVGTLVLTALFALLAWRAARKGSLHPADKG